MFDLKGKIVLITGASSGIGAAAARGFAALGAKLIIAARRSEKLKEISAELIEIYGADVLSLKLDVRNSADVKKTFNSLPDDWKDIEVLVNNAGLAIGMEKFQDGDVSDWEKVIDTNVKGVIYCARFVLEGMIARDRGHIINIGSVAGHDVYPGGAIYCATKHAVDAITRALRHDLLGTKIRVTAIDPGLVETEFSVVRFKGDAEKAKKVYAGMTPLTPEDIADAIIYCATRPPHVNVNDMILMPVDQASVWNVSRK